ncbi:MAG: Uma2 family endonuclease [Lachnospiraceae bacterium]|nr:Uma2 family endonuclease [Lachnospiraceae bacterium]
MALPQEQLYTTNDIYALPEGQRAELIDGRLYMMAPPMRIHQKLTTELVSFIHWHIKGHNGSCEVYPAPFAVFLNEDDRNYVEPDISVICDKNKLTDRGCSGAPDWIIEIASPSTERMDYGIKLFKYRTAGIREYWIVNPMTRTVNVYDFEHDEKTRQYTFDQEITSCIYEDFVIQIASLIE